MGVMLVVWEDGIEEEPGGCLLREVPGGDWDDQSWISKDGRTFQRTFEPLQSLWVWSAERAIHMGDDDALGVDLFGGAKRRRTRLARAIALAWLDCPRRGSHAVAREAVDAATISWQSGGTLRTLGLGANEDWVEDGEPPVDGWTPMRYMWVNGNGDVVERIDVDAPVQYMVHKSGWIRSLLCGRATQGHRTPDGRRWAAVHGSGLVCVDLAVEQSFGTSPVLSVNTPRISRTAVQTLEAVKRQRTAAQICKEHAILPSTLWTRLLLLSRSASWDDAKVLWSLCPKDVRTALREHRLVEDEGVKAMLCTVRRLVDEACPIRNADDEDAYGMLRVGWALVRRERLRGRV